MKAIAALAAAAFFGLWAGVMATASLAYPDIVTEVPAWVEPARQLRTMALAAFGVCAVGWIALDWLEVDNAADS